MPTTPARRVGGDEERGIDAAAVLAGGLLQGREQALAEVSDPVTAVPSQPRIGEKNAKAAPCAPAMKVPIVMVMPARFMT